MRPWLIRKNNHWQNFDRPINLYNKVIVGKQCMFPHTQFSTLMAFQRSLWHRLDIISSHYVLIFVEHSRGWVAYKVVFCGHAMNGCICVSGRVTPLIFNPGSMWRWMVTFALPLLCTETRSATPDCAARYLRLTVGLCALDKRKSFLSLSGIELIFLGYPSFSQISVSQSCTVDSVWVISEQRIGILKLKRHRE